jgi:ATP-dependent Clp protease ATP-binding subunit ClpC
MYERFTDRGRKVLQLANQEAQHFNHDCIGTEHILLGLVKEGSGVAANVLKNLDVDLRKVRLEVERIAGAGPATVTVGKLPLTPRAMKALQYSLEESRRLSHNYVGTEHLLLGVLREKQGAGLQILVNLGLTAQQVRREVTRLLSLTQPKLSSSTEAAPLQASPPDMSRTSLLDHFGRDLTQLAGEGVLDPVVGRDRELEQVVQILCQDSVNNALLVGDDGVGKTALVEGLARRVATASVPERLRCRRIISMDAAAIAPQEAFRWLLGERMQRLIREVSKKERFCLLIENMDILFADEVTRGIIASASSPEMGSELRFIGSTTPARAATCLESQSSFRAGFCLVALEPLTPETTLTVLRTLRGRDEAMYHLLIADEALEAAVELGQQAGTTRLPGAAIRLLESACLLVRPQGEQPNWKVAAAEAKIELLTEEKEAAVAEQDFEKAARLRDQAEKLKTEKERQREESLKQRRESYCVVDRAAVSAAAGR